MASRFVRFAPSFSSNDDNNNKEEDAAANQQHGAAAADGTRRPSINSALEASMKATNFPQSRRASNSSSVGSYRRASTSSNVSDAQTMGTAARKVNTAIAANDGPSLAAALAQSIRHHARMIDGEQPSIKQQRVASRPAYDPYEDDDHVSLAPGVELNYEREASAPNNAPSNNKQQGAENATPPALRDFVANAGVEDTEDGSKAGGGGGGAAIDRTVEQQQERIDKRLRDDSFGARFRTNISNWFGGFGMDSSGRDGGLDFSSRSRSVRFADDDDTVAVAAAIANGEAVPGAAFGIVGRAPKFVAPPPASFRTATRHPSHLPMGEFDNVESRLNAPRRILAARKRHRRNDSFLRLMVAVLCFALSLTFAIIYGEGRFGLAVTTMAYERKIAGRYDVDDSGNSNDQSLNEREEDVFYPEWWENEKGIPDMVDMRMLGNSANHSRNKKLITATPRQLEAIIRLSEAHARLHYRDAVLREDVVEAVRLMNVATQKAATDPTTGTIDMDMITTGQTAKGRQLLAALVSELRNMLAAQFRGKSVTFIEIQRAMESDTVTVQSDELEEALRQLSDSGIVSHNESSRTYRIAEVFA